MPIVNPPVIPPAPPAPQRDDPATFEERNDAAVEYQFDTLPPALNAISDAAYQNALETKNLAQQAQGNANFKGLWSSLTGPLEIPASVYHDGDYWNLLVDLADVTASEPSASNSDWAVSVVRLADSFEIGDFRSSLVELDDNYLRRDGAMYPISSYPALAALLPSYPSDFEWSAQNIGTSQDVRAIIRLSEFELIAVASTIPSSDATDVLYSPNNGSTWELRATIAGFQGTAIVRNPNDGTLIIGGAGAKFCSSVNDGATWSAPATMPSLNSSAIICGMLHFNGAYFAVGAGDRDYRSHVMRSVDGAAWASVYAIPFEFTYDHGQATAIFEGLGRLYVSWMAAGELGFAMSDSAGTTFTRQTVGGNQANFPKGGVATDTGIVAPFWISGGTSTTLSVYGTTNGTDWAETASVPASVSGTLLGVTPVYANNTLVFNTSPELIAVGTGAADEFEFQALPSGFAVTQSETEAGAYGRPEISNDGRTVLFPGEGGMVARGIAVPAGQFRVPDDAPLDGWVKAKGTPVEDASQVVIKNLPAIVAAADNAAAAASSATAAAASATTAQDAAAEAQAIVWEGATGFPKIRPTLSQDFANSKTVDPRITFTRASAAPYWDEKGVLRTAAPGEPRIDHDPVSGECLGYLSEGSATNLLTYSEQFDNANWAKTGSVVTPNEIGAPDGAVSADLLIENANATPHYLLTGEQSFIAGNRYTFSCFAKNYSGGSKRYITLLFTSSVAGSNIRVTVDLETGDSHVTGNAESYRVKYVGYGWYRVSLTILAISTVTTIAMQLRISNVLIDALSSYTGDGTSGIYIWGAQLEVGTEPSSYIKTEATAVTRAADSAVMTGDNFSSWYNQSEGTFYVESSSMTTQGYRQTLEVSGGSQANRIRTLRWNDGSERVGSVDAGGVNEFAGYFGSGESAENTKYSWSYRENDFASVRNGGPPVTGASGAVPAVNRMDIASTYSGLFPLNGHIRRIAYWPRRLPNEQLQALTAE